MVLATGKHHKLARISNVPALPLVREQGLVPATCDEFANPGPAE